MNIQLLFFPGCPNVDAARDTLRRALRASGLQDRFEEVDVSAPDAPASLRRWGSPTILVDGVDVDGTTPSGSSCRLYRFDGSKVSGVPSEEAILRAVASSRPRGRSGLRALAVVPGAVLALLPSATCPACVAAYAGVLSAVGLGFLFDERVLAPLIGVLLVLGVASVGYSTRSHRHPGPMAVTLVGSGAVVAGRLLWDIPPVLYGGVALLVGASLWSLWLKRPRPAPLLQVRRVGREGDA